MPWEGDAGAWSLSDIPANASTPTRPGIANTALSANMTLPCTITHKQQVPVCG
jgi:hypothetical protein